MGREVTAVLLALLKRPLPEIAALAGMVILVILSVGVSFNLIARGLALLRIKKIGVTGIECETKKR